ncbi:hypothetical protein [Streptomyces anulatus]|uniref:hypothetical protein n=1 Tax=Streptomyces anulatus TaxID=1892 RepID=UPI0033F04A6F
MKPAILSAPCGSRFTDERWEAAEETDWGRLVDTHPTLCDSCKHDAVAHDVDQQEQPEQLPDWAQHKRFLRFTSRPRCTECRAAFTDERWQAVNRTGWDPLLQERHPTLCQTCIQEYDDSIKTAWPDRRAYESPERPELKPYPSRRAADDSHACGPDRPRPGSPAQRADLKHLIETRE